MTDTPIIENKKKLLKQSSYLTRLDSEGCRESSLSNTTFVLSVTFNSEEFPEVNSRLGIRKKITTAKVFESISQEQYEDVLKELKGSG